MIRPRHIQLGRSDGVGWHAPLGPAEAVLWCESAESGAAAVRLSDGATLGRWDDPLAALAWMAGTPISANQRWVGFLSYDLGRLFERLPAITADDLRLPLFVFTLHSPLTALRGRVGEAVIAQRPPPPYPSPGVPRKGEEEATARSHFSRSQYEAAVARAIEYIRAGDIFQVNLSQRFTAKCSLSPRELYERLRFTAPMPYAGLLDYGSSALVCNSPELFLRVTPDRRVVTRPIKGTRPAAAGMEGELRDSEKDRAELNMIVDLERNDLGRVCEFGSVRVTAAREIERHPAILHGVATVEGRLRRDVSFVDLLRATFPGGSITGAPKIRAMEIIEELEPVRRGPYCGAIGYVGGDGTIEFNIAIRTIVLKDGLAHIPVGGGVVADSVPAGEYLETLVKARSMFEALGVTDVAE